MAAPVKTESKTKSGLFGFGKKEKPATPDTQAAPTVSTKAPKEESLNKRFRRETQELADAVGQMQGAMRELEVLMAEAIKLFGHEEGNIEKLNAELVESMNILSQEKGALERAGTNVPFHLQRARSCGDSLLKICDSDKTKAGAQELHDKVKKILEDLDKVEQRLAGRPATVANGAGATTAQKASQPVLVVQDQAYRDLKTVLETADKSTVLDAVDGAFSHIEGEIDNVPKTADGVFNAKWGSWQSRLELLAGKMEQTPEAERSDQFKKDISKVKSKLAQVRYLNRTALAAREMDQIKISYRDGAKTYKGDLDRVVVQLGSTQLDPHFDVNNRKNAQFLTNCQTLLAEKAATLKNNFKILKKVNEKLGQARRSKAETPPFEDIAKADAARALSLSGDHGSKASEIRKMKRKLVEAKKSLDSIPTINKDLLVQKIDARIAKLDADFARANEASGLYHFVYQGKSLFQDLAKNQQPGTPASKAALLGNWEADYAKWKHLDWTQEVGPKVVLWKIEMNEKYRQLIDNRNVAMPRCLAR